MAQRKRPPARGTGPKGRPTPRQAPPRAAASRGVPPRRPQDRAPSPSGKPFLTPGGSPFRHAVERRSAVLLVFLHRLPRAVPGLLVLALVAVGLIAPPVVSGVALLVVAALLVWLVFLSWPGVPAVGRAVRLVVVALVVGYALTRFV